MADPRDVRGAWNDAGERLTELGRKLKTHYDEQHGSHDQQSRQELADAARKVRGALQDAFEAIGAAAKDSAVQADVKGVGLSLADAVGATLGQASEEVRRAFAERKGSATSFEEPAAPPVTTGPATAAGEEAGEEARSGQEPGEEPRPGGEDGDDGTAPKVEPWGTP